MKLTRFLIVFICLIGLLMGCNIDDNTPKNESDTPKEQVKEQLPQQVPNPEEQDETPSEPVKKENEYYSGIPRGKVLVATIVRVVDGDTMNIKVNGKEETVRLLLFDTPETVHPSKPVQPFGPEASAFAKEILTPGKQVEIEIDISERDKNGKKSTPSFNEKCPSLFFRLE